MSKRLDAQRCALLEAERIARHLEKMKRVAAVAPPPKARSGKSPANAVQPRPMREVKTKAPSKPDTWTGGTVDPPCQTKAERKVKDLAGGKTAKKATKARRLAGTSISNIAGSKRDAERIQALDRQRQKEVKAALIAEIRSRPKATTSVAVSRFKKVSADSASAADYDRTRASLATKQRHHTRKQAPPPEAHTGKKSVNAVQPRPIRELQPAPPSKPDTWKGGTVKPPLLTEAERNAVKALKPKEDKRAARTAKVKQEVPKKKPGTGWDGEKSNDILDSWTRLDGSPFSGKRSK